MTTDDLISRLHTERGVFDAKVMDVPRCALDLPTPGGAHSAKEIVAHVTAYEDLIVKRLQAARHGETTAFDRDRAGWKEFNDRIWPEAGPMEIDAVFSRSAEVFSALVDEVGTLTDEELNGRSGLTVWIDPEWLGDRTLGKMIEIDAIEHYPMHYKALMAAAKSESS